MRECPICTVNRSSIGIEQIPASEGLSLTALLDLFGPEHSAGAPAAAGPRVGSPRIVLRARFEGWIRRAAGWGAGPQGAWRAW